MPDLPRIVIKVGGSLLTAPDLAARLTALLDGQPKLRPVFLAGGVPVPTFASPPLPDIAPEKVVEVLSPPAVRIAARSSTLPAPASEPMVWFRLLRSRIAPASPHRGSRCAISRGSCARARRTRRSTSICAASSRAGARSLCAAAPPRAH